MTQPTTERACDLCRERRVKCDKTQPSCLRCSKLGKQCPGYDKKRKFVDEGVSLRKKFQGGAGGEVEDANASLQLGVPETAHQEHLSTVLPQVSATQEQQSRLPPSNVEGMLPKVNDALSSSTIAELHHTNQQITKSYDTAGQIHMLMGQEPAAPLDLPLEGLLDIPEYDPTWFNIDPEIYYDNNTNSCGFIPNLQIVDEVDRDKFKLMTETSSGTPMSMTGVNNFSNIDSMTGITNDGNMWALGDQLRTSARITDEREHEMAYLIRHFTETLAPWLDLFDNDNHFQHIVPLRALGDALLRNAIAAVAAKQLGRVNGVKPFLGLQCQRPATMEMIGDAVPIDWFYKAANYYDKAIAFSRIYLEALSGSLSQPASPNTQTTLSVANSDDLLVAVSIFSLYESLDNREVGWSQHLSGLKSLLTAIRTNQQEHVQYRTDITSGRKASFWNFARGDYQAAYINRRMTYLDTNDLAMWRNCGLELQDDGMLYAEPTSVKSDPDRPQRIAQLVSHTLLWIVLGVTNYCALETQSSGATQQATWDRLTAQLDQWYSTLPETFQPCARIRHIPFHQPVATANTTAQLTEVFFSIDACAAALHLYHFARILLLLNKPRDQKGVSRLKAYREVSAEAIKHARAIISIALGRPPPAVRVEMLLPLYIAGGCLEADEERKVVLQVMKAIGQDTGCSTEVTVRSLIDEWGWNQEPEGID